MILIRFLVQLLLPRWMVLAGTASCILGLGALLAQLSVEEEINGSFFSTALAISSDGQWAAIGTVELLVEMWNVTTGEMVARVKEETVPSSLCFSPSNDELLYTGHGFIPHLAIVRDANIKLYDVPSMALRRRIRVMGGVITEAVFAPKETALAIIRQVVGQWDLNTGSRTRSFELPTKMGNRIQLTPDGTWIVYGASVTEGREISAYDPRYKRKLVESPEAFAKAYQTHISADGRWLAAVGLGNDQQGQLQIWDVTTGQLAAQAADSQVPIQVQFLDDLRIGTCSENGRIVTWQFTPGQGIKQLAAIEGNTSQLFFASWTPDGRFVATATELTFSVWDVAAGKQHRLLSDRLSLHAERRVAKVACWLCFGVGISLLLFHNRQMFRVARPHLATTPKASPK